MRWKEAVVGLRKLVGAKTGKLWEVYTTATTLIRSLTPMQKVELMAVLTPEQLAMGMMAYQAWQDAWEKETEKEKDS